MPSTASASLLPQRSAAPSSTARAVLRTVIASASADAAGSPFSAPAADVSSIALQAAALAPSGSPAPQADASGAGFAAAVLAPAGVAFAEAAPAPPRTSAPQADLSGAAFAAAAADPIGSGIGLGAAGAAAQAAARGSLLRGADGYAENGTKAEVAQDAARPGAHASRWWGLLLPLAALATAELAVRSGALPASQLPPPSAVAETLADLARNGLAQHIAASTLRVLTGFAAGAALAIALGAAVGLSQRLSALLDPAFQALRAIPSLAWVPLLLLWLGIDEAPKIVLIAIGAFFPVYMGVASGIRDVDRKLIEVGRLYRLNGVQLARRVLLPAALPAILTGLRNGLSLAWMFMVAAELIAASKGLGYLLSDGRETSRADIVIAAIVLLAILGKISDGVMHSAETRLLHWRDSFGAGAAQ